MDVFANKAWTDEELCQVFGLWSQGGVQRHEIHSSGKQSANIIHLIIVLDQELDV